MEDRDGLSGEEGVQDTNVLTVRSYVARVLFFVVQCIMHNFQNVLKRILHITAQQLKARIVEDLERYLKRGRFRRKLSLRVFYGNIAHYNRQRALELRARLAEV